VSDLAPRPRHLPVALKFTLELGPLALFFLCYAKFGIFAATWVMMAAVLVTLAVSYWQLKRVPTMPLVTAAIVLVFGGLTQYLHDPTFVKIKPTVLYTLFSGALFFGLIFNKPMLQVMFDGALHLTAEGWRKLSWRWAIFFLVLAGLNELVWRTMSEEHWVMFKSFGFLPITVVFALAQAPLIARFEAKSDTEEDVL